MILSNNPGTEVPGYFRSVPTGRPERCSFDIRPVPLTLGALQVGLMLKGRNKQTVPPFQGFIFFIPTQGFGSLRGLRPGLCCYALSALWIVPLA
jgi:hypothetical protein